MSQKSLLVVVLLFIGKLVTMGCSQNKESDPSESNSSVPITATTNDPATSGSGDCTIVPIPDAPLAAGQLVFSLPADIDPCSVKGYVVGFKEQLRVVATPDRKYFINNVPAGEHDVLITAGVVAINLASGKENDRGRRINKVKFLNGVKTENGEIDLPNLGSLSGFAKLIGQNDHAGIDVYVPGTDMIAKTDSNGNFSISNVPVGEHNLYFERDGYHRGQVEAVNVESESDSKIGDIFLAISTGSDGFILAEKGANVIDSLVVELTIGATPDAVLMKLSESNLFEGASWKPIVSTTSYKFDSPGSKTLFVKFADANGLESSPYRASILIELFPKSISFESTPTKVSSRSVTVDFTKLRNAHSIRISEDSSFPQIEWKVFGSPSNFTFSAPGEKTIFVSFRSEDGFESPVYKHDINVQIFAPGEGSVEIGGSSAYWTSLAIPVSFTKPALATKIGIGESPDFAGSAKFDTPGVTGNIHYTTSTDGQKTIYVWFLDKDGFASEVTSRQIFVDSTVPDAPVVSSFSHPSGSQPVDYDLFLVAVGSKDVGGSGVHSICYSIDQTNNTLVSSNSPAVCVNAQGITISELSYTGSGARFSASFPSAPGVYYFHASAIDYAGKISPTTHYQFTSIQSFSTVGKLDLGVRNPVARGAARLTNDQAGNKIIWGVFETSFDANVFSGTDTINPVPGGVSAYVTKLNSDGTYGWSRAFGGPQFQILDLKVKSNGDIMVVGEWTKTVDFDPTSGQDLKVSPNGHQSSSYILTLKANGSYGGVLVQDCHLSSIMNVELDAADNIFIVGQYRTGGAACDVDPTATTLSRTTSGQTRTKFVMKINSDNSFSFINEFGTTQHTDFDQTRIRSSMDQSSGALFLIEPLLWYSRSYSTTGGSINLSPTSLADGNNGDETVIIKFTNAGDISWAKPLSSVPVAGQTSSQFRVGDIEVDNAGNLLLVGYASANKIGAGWDLDPGSGAQTIVATAAFDDVNFCLRIDTNGDYSSHVIFPKKTIMQHVSVNPSNDNIYISGYINDTADFSFGGTSEVLTKVSTPINYVDYFLITFNNNFEKQWVKQWGLGGQEDSTSKPIVNVDGSVWDLVQYKTDKFSGFDRLTDAIILSVP